MITLTNAGDSVEGETLYYHHFWNRPETDTKDGRIHGVLKGRGEVIENKPLQLHSKRPLRKISCRSATFECDAMDRPKYKQSGNHRGWRGYLNGNAKATIRVPMIAG